MEENGKLIRESDRRDTRRIARRAPRIQHESYMVDIAPLTGDRIINRVQR